MGLHTGQWTSHIGDLGVQMVFEVVRDRREPDKCVPWDSFPTGSRFQDAEANLISTVKTVSEELVNKIQWTWNNSYILCNLQYVPDLITWHTELADIKFNLQVMVFHSVTSTGKIF